MAKDTFQQKIQLDWVAANVQCFSQVTHLKSASNISFWTLVSLWAVIYLLIHCDIWKVCPCWCHCVNNEQSSRFCTCSTQKSNFWPMKGLPVRGQWTKVLCHLHIIPTGAVLPWKAMPWSHVSAGGGLELLSYRVTSVTFMYYAAHHSVTFHGLPLNCCGS